MFEVAAPRTRETHYCNYPRVSTQPTVLIFNFFSDYGPSTGSDDRGIRGRHVSLCEAIASGWKRISMAGLVARRRFSVAGRRSRRAGLCAHLTFFVFFSGGGRGRLFDEVGDRWESYVSM